MSDLYVLRRRKWACDSDGFELNGVPYLLIFKDCVNIAARKPILTLCLYFCPKCFLLAVKCEKMS